MNKDGKMLVFVVDDDVFYLKTVVMGLDKHYHSSVVFKYFFNSHDLLAELKKSEHMPDLILLDYNLDDNISGIDLLKEVKSINSTLDVVMVSSQQNLQTVFSTLQNGARSYIQKGDKVLVEIKKTIDDKLISIKQEAQNRKIKKWISAAFVVFAIVAAAMLLMKK